MKKNKVYLTSLIVTLILTITGLIIGFILISSNDFMLWRTRAGEKLNILMFMLIWLPSLISLFGLLTGIISIKNKNKLFLYLSLFINSIYDIYWVLVLFVILCTLFNISFVSITSFIISVILLTVLLSLNYIAFLEQKKFIK